MTPRFRSGLVPLRDGRALFAGGMGTAPLSSAEIFDPGYAVVPGARPTLSTPALLLRGATFTLPGTQLRGVTRSPSSGSFLDSSTAWPYLRLRRIDNDDLRPLTAFDWSDTGLSFALPSSWPRGPARLSVVSVGASSIEAYVW
ncbi:MAG: hypothetical protein ACYC8T_19310 [Myxococcaceae bacterium]